MKPRSRLTIAVTAVAAALLALPAIAAARDANHDRIPDRWEKRHNLSLQVKQTNRDQDRDHLRNRAEFLAGTNPRKADSDGDGTGDGEENAGTIASFDPASGQLAIDLFGGGTVTGLITEETEIECGDLGTTASASDSPEDAEGDDEGQQGGEPGDEDGPDEEPGDDDGTGSGSTCTSAGLAPGAVVHEAELQIDGAGAVFEKVELAG